nr:glycosyltransferase family 8 protein [Lachnospiraceae bacterium]
MGVIDFVTNEIVSVGNHVVPVFFACDNNFVKYMMVSIKSLADHTDPLRKYKIHVLHTDISAENQKRVKAMEQPNLTIEFNDVTERLERVKKKLLIRDYYSSTTYYRLFIADMFPQYDKVVYIDSDTVVLKDVYNLFRYKLGDNYVGAVHEQLVMRQDVFGRYVEDVMCVSRGAYFNAGVLLINSKIFRKKNMLKQFTDMLNTYSF